MQQVRFGIVGVGNMGSAHLSHILRGNVPELKVTAVADINPARLKAAKAAAEKAGQPIEGFPTAAALFESGLCDAVIIATPHYDHPPLVIEALAHNLHVITEKPAGVYTKQVREMNEAAAKSDKLFAVMFNQRTNHIYRKMKELVSSGRYGEIRRTNWIITDWFRCQSYYNSGGWRATWAGEGGGVLLNQCPHNLDLWQWICGMPAKVRAFCKEGHFHEIEVEDDVTAYVEYPTGATGVFISTTGEFPGTNRFEIVLDRATILCENGKLSVFELEDSQQHFIDTCPEGFGRMDGGFIDIETDGENPQHDGVLRAFAAAILRGEPLIARGEEGINGLTLSNAMFLSSWLNETVTLPLDEELFYAELKKRIDSSKAKKESQDTVVFNVEGTFGS